MYKWTVHSSFLFISNNLKKIKASNYGKGDNIGLIEVFVVIIFIKFMNLCERRRRGKRDVQYIDESDTGMCNTSMAV